MNKQSTIPMPLRNPKIFLQRIYLLSSHQSRLSFNIHSTTLHNVEDKAIGWKEKLSLSDFRMRIIQYDFQLSEIIPFFHKLFWISSRKLKFLGGRYFNKTRDMLSKPEAGDFCDEIAEDNFEIENGAEIIFTRFYSPCKNLGPPRRRCSRDFLFIFNI